MERWRREVIHVKRVTVDAAFPLNILGLLCVRQDRMLALIRNPEFLPWPSGDADADRR